MSSIVISVPELLLSTFTVSLRIRVRQRQNTGSLSRLPLRAQEAARVQERSHASQGVLGLKCEVKGTDSRIGRLRGPNYAEFRAQRSGKRVGHKGNIGKIAE